MDGARGSGGTHRSSLLYGGETQGSPELGNFGAPGLDSSSGLAQEVHHAMRDSLEATAGHRKARSGVFGDDGGSGWRVSPECARSRHTGLGLGEETGP